MKPYLLDTNLLIALLWPSHQDHDRAVRWFSRHRRQGWATCPLTEAGFVRIVSNPAFSRDAVQPREAMQVLAANTAAKDHVFWQDDLPLAEAVAFAGERLLGHQQLTDAYLIGLAIHHRGLLATLDQGLATLVESNPTAAQALQILS
ncbi:MAG: PIN domain-containing protein [Verrucomicrobia bacterium]|nr:MAG: PIN domain-containing protein [Verrucomicrobiota bacterium]